MFLWFACCALLHVAHLELSFGSEPTVNLIGPIGMSYLSQFERSNGFKYVIGNLPTSKPPIEARLDIKEILTGHANLSP